MENIDYEWKLFVPKNIADSLQIKSICENESPKLEKPLKSSLSKFATKPSESEWVSFVLPEIVQPAQNTEMRIEKSPPFNLEFVTVKRMSDIPLPALLLMNSPDFQIRFLSRELPKPPAFFNHQSQTKSLLEKLLLPNESPFKNSPIGAYTVLVKKAPSLYKPCSSLNRATSKINSQLYGLLAYKENDAGPSLYGFPLIDLGNVPESLAWHLYQNDTLNDNVKNESECSAYLQASNIRQY